MQELVIVWSRFSTTRLLVTGDIWLSSLTEGETYGGDVCDGSIGEAVKLHPHVQREVAAPDAQFLKRRPWSVESNCCGDQNPKKTFFLHVHMYKLKKNSSSSRWWSFTGKTLHQYFTIQMWVCLLMLQSNFNAIWLMIWSDETLSKTK